MKDRKITIKTLEEIANRIMGKYEGMSEEEIERYMLSLIEKAKDDIILKAMGLERDTWDNTLKVRYNGSFSQVYEAMGKPALDKITRVFYDEFLKKISCENVIDLLTKTDIKKVTEYIKENYLSYVLRNIEDILEEKAKFDAEVFVNNYFSKKE